MKYHVNFDDLNDFKEVFQKKIDDFNEVIYKIYKSSQKVEWVGLGHDKTIEALYLQIEELKKVYIGLGKFVEFVDIALNNYSEGVVEVNNKFQKMEEIIDMEKTRRGGI